MTTVTISLPDSLKDFIEREVETKGYGNVSEYMRGLLREAQKKEEAGRLEALLLEGLTSGEMSLNREFWREIKREAAQMLVRKKRIRRRQRAR